MVPLDPVQLVANVRPSACQRPNRALPSRDQIATFGARVVSRLEGVEVTLGTISDRDVSRVANSQ